MKDLTKLLTTGRVASNCILCGKAPLVLGVFTPNDSQKFGAPRGKSRVVLYALCGEHYSSDGEHLPAVEAQILEDLVAIW